MTGNPFEKRIKALAGLQKHYATLRTDVNSCAWTGAAMPELAAVRFSVDQKPCSSADALAELGKSESLGWWRCVSGSGWRANQQDAGPGADLGSLVSGEWISGLGKSVRAGPGEGGLTLWRFEEKDSFGDGKDGLIPALCEESLLLSRGGDDPRTVAKAGDYPCLVYRVYWGFADEAAAANGELRRLACRFAGFASRPVVTKADLGEK